MRKILSLFLLFSASLFAQSREQDLVQHVIESIAKARAEQSSLAPQVLDIDGMSSSKVRHFLNQLCSLPGVSYFEVGCWKGSTLIAALYNNQPVQAIAVDDWSEFGGPRADFLRNIQRFLPSSPLQVVEGDCFSLNRESLFPLPVNIYFYDGAHDALSQEKAFTYFNDIFEDVFIAVVDDWNHPPVRQGTRAAFSKLSYEILYEEALPASRNGDRAAWWNGLYVAVIKRQSLN
jgi:hypothetical protein